MIVKVQMKEGWIFFDNIEKFESLNMLLKDISKLQINKQWITLNFDREKNNDRLYMKVLYLFRDNKILNALVIDNNLCYLLNTEGSTIERIN